MQNIHAVAVRIMRDMETWEADCTTPYCPFHAYGSLKAATAAADAHEAYKAEQDALAQARA